MKTGIFMADGCEEIEGLTVVDILRRAGLEIEMISISSSKSVTGSHGITFLTDTVFEDVNFDALDAVGRHAGNLTFRSARRGNIRDPSICSVRQTDSRHLRRSFRSGSRRNFRR